MDEATIRTARAPEHPGECYELGLVMVKIKYFLNALNKVTTCEAPPYRTI